ncbi:hypothetical protein F2Q70_00044361, partial [Brassica cretica]
TSALVEELNRVSAENKKLSEMLTLMCENYNVLRKQLMEYVNKSNNMTERDQTSPPMKRKSPARDDAVSSAVIGGVSESSSTDQDGQYLCKKKQREETVVKEKVSRVSYKTEASDTTLVVKDGYQWRKYGQKVTRNNPSPRAYFKCACAPSCSVKKKGFYEILEAMGMASMNSSGESLKLCVFDLRRGQNEGQELDKIFFFYPPDVTFSTQLSVIGLSEGLITFTRLFSPEAACEVIEAERHSHVFHEAEPDIWMVMVVEKNKEIEAIWRVDALQKVLKEVHSLFVMFHGSIRSLLDKDPSGGLIRSHLYPFITDYLNDLSVGKKLQLPSFRETLKERGTVQMLTLARDAALEVQSLVGVLDSCAGTLRCHSVILFHDLLVSTTLSPDDTVDLFTFSVMRLTSNALSSGTSSWSYLRKGTSLSQTSSRSTSPQLLVSSDPLSSNGNDAGRVIRPLQHNKWSKGKDGFLVTDIWGLQANEQINRN